MINGTYAENGAIVSEMITVPAGTYIVSFSYGYVQDVGLIGLMVNNVMDIQGLAGAVAPSFVLCLTFAVPTILSMASGQVAQFTVSSGERSALTAIRIE